MREMLSRPDEFSARLLAADHEQLTRIIRYFCAQSAPAEREALFACADGLRRRHYGKKVYFRGLVEFSSYCKNDCYYCGLRRGNAHASRYRLTEAEILGCCARGHDLGFRSFVLQSGEDPYFTDERMCGLIQTIKRRHPDCAVSLSLGERSEASYKKMFDAGADRYLLRHEAADGDLYGRLHPPQMRLEKRKRCLYALREIGYQVGAGFMVDSPGQTDEALAWDFIFLRDLRPQMIGVGPFIPHRQTPFAGHHTPTSDKTLILLALIRIMLPQVLLPTTTALGTVDPQGREKGLRAGANVVMPNLSPVERRKAYDIYDDKICTGEEAAECLACLSKRIESAGYEPDFSRGDYIGWPQGAPGV
jgi:biotin synthase